MKTKILVVCAILFLCIVSCDNDDDNNCQGTDCLPPATQTGEGTFGCLINGKPYVDNSGNFNCFYQLVDGEYFFNISAKRDINNIDQIRISSNMSQIDISTINLNENSPNEFYAEIGLLNISGDFTTSDMPDGTVTFTEFDTNSNIVSAIFEFTIQIPSTGETLEITEGRFDSFFTQ